MKWACRATRHILFYSMWATSSDYIDCQKIALTIKHQDKKGFRYHGNQAKLQRLKSLVNTNGKHGFDLKNFQFHYQLPIFFKETAKGLPILLLATASGTLACGSIPSFPLTTHVQYLFGGLYLLPRFTTNQVQCWRERTSSPLSTTLGICLLVTQNLASYSVKSLPPGRFLKRYI